MLANRPPRLSSSLFHRRTLSEASACISRTSSVPPRSQLRERPLSPSQVPIPASPPAVAGVSLPLPSLPPTRLPNDRVSIPIPDDDLAHVPVPVWSPLPASDTALCTATSVTPTRPPRRSVSPALILARSASVSSRSTVGYFDALPGLLSDDSAGESDGEDSFGLPKSTSTMRSFSGSRHSFAEQVIPTRLRVPHGIEPPVEEVDEPSSAPTSPSTRPPTPFAYNPTKPKSRPSSICSNNSPSSPAHSNRLSRGSYKSNKSKSKPKRLDGEPGWRPSGIGFLVTWSQLSPFFIPLTDASFRHLRTRAKSETQIIRLFLCERLLSSRQMPWLLWTIWCSNRQKRCPLLLPQRLFLAALHERRPQGHVPLPMKVVGRSSSPRMTTVGDFRWI